MVMWCRLGHLGLGLPVFRGLLRSLLLRVPAASFAQRLLAHLSARGGLVGDSPQEFHRGPATRYCLLPPPRHGHASGLALVLKSLVPQPTDFSDVQLRFCERDRAVKLFIPGLGGAGPRDVAEDAPPSGFGASALDRCGLAAWLRPGLEVAELEVTPVLCTPLTLEVENRNPRADALSGLWLGKDARVVIGGVAGLTPPPHRPPDHPAMGHRCHPASQTKLHPETRSA